MTSSKNAVEGQNSFVGLQLRKGTEFYAKRDSGEAGGNLQDSEKDLVPNPETPSMAFSVTTSLRNAGNKQKG